MTGGVGAEIVDHVKVGTVAPGFVMLPFWIADELGFFAGEGIRTSLEICGTTDRTTDALRAGDIQIAFNSPEGAISDAMIGGLLFLVGGLANRPPLSLIARPKYKRIHDLRGARIGTSSLKEGTCQLVNEMLGAHGLRSGDDYEFVLAGAHPQRWAALQEGTIDAALQLMPFDYLAEEKGFSNLGSATDCTPEFAFACLCASRGWADLNASVLQRFLSALRAGVSFLYEQPEQAAHIATRSGSGELRHALRACHELTDGEMIPRDLAISAGAFQRTVEAMRASGAIPADATYEPNRALRH
jgi:NitT/TauT family transport system substrate-binding protein